MPKNQVNSCFSAALCMTLLCTPTVIGEKPAVLFNPIDADQNGVITLSEYLAIYTPHFERFDANSAGVLDDSEIWKVK